MNFIDAPGIRQQLFPFAEIRPVENIRIGILTIREKWSLLMPASFSGDIPSNLLPNARHVQSATEVGSLKFSMNDIFLSRPWHIFQHNAAAIHTDYDLLTLNRVSKPLSATNRVSGDGKIFLEEGAIIEHSIINAQEGPVYIGRNAQVMEGCLLRGPLALCEGAVLKMGTCVYGGTTLGPFSVGGGEIKNSVIFGYSNKGHDGYLGDSVIGEWCNLGAGASNSNLKNNAGQVTVYDHLSGGKINAGTKCGLLMGDYSRAAINTSFNTGTVIGICCNIFSSGLTPTYVPSFSWGANNDQRYDFEKAVRDIQNWKRLKKMLVETDEINRLRSIFDNQ